MEIKEIVERNYAAQLRRGTITQETNLADFLDKLDEETGELLESQWSECGDFVPNHFDQKELADIILVCLSMAKHCDIDILQVMAEKTEYNEKRED